MSLHGVNVPQAAEFSFFAAHQSVACKEAASALGCHALPSAIDTFQASGILWRPVSTLKRFLILSTGAPS